jgi:hypothetical protein
MHSPAAGFAKSQITTVGDLCYGKAWSIHRTGNDAAR